MDTKQHPCQLFKSLKNMGIVCAGIDAEGQFVKCADRVRTAPDAKRVLCQITLLARHELGNRCLELLDALRQIGKRGRIFRGLCL